MNPIRRWWRRRRGAEPTLEEVKQAFVDLSRAIDKKGVRYIDLADGQPHDLMVVTEGSETKTFVDGWEQPSERTAE